MICLGGSLGDLECHVPDERTPHRTGSSRSRIATALVIAEIEATRQMDACKG